MFSVLAQGNDIRSGVALDSRTCIASRIRVPGGIFTVSIDDPISGKIVYLAINAAPHGVQGKELVRWRGVPDQCSPTLRVTLWRQRETLKNISKPHDGDLPTFVKHHGLRTIDAFDFQVKKS